MVPLKFPINISKLIPRDTVVTDAFGLCTKNLRRHLFQHDQVCDDPIRLCLERTNPDYHWRVYAYRSTRKTKEDVIGNLASLQSRSHKKFIHVNVDYGSNSQFQLLLFEPLTVPRGLELVFQTP
jgi:hypothetical protein